MLLIYQPPELRPVSKLPSTDEYRRVPIEYRLQILPNAGRFDADVLREEIRSAPMKQVSTR